jgi:hypothetical protein
MVFSKALKETDGFHGINGKEPKVLLEGNLTVS